MINRSLWITAAWAVAAGMASPALLAEPKGHVVRSRAVEPLSQKLLDRIDARLRLQLRAAGVAIEQGADPDVVEAGYAAGYHGRNDPWNDILQVSRPNNPLLTESCRERALARVLDNASDRAGMREHLKGQSEIWEQVRQGARHLRLSDILLHMADCREGCGPYLSGVQSCHIEGVRRRLRTIVYFDTDRPRMREERYYVFSRRDERRITEFAGQAVAGDHDVMLFSRVTGAGAFDRHNISGNNALAWRRARVVDKLLTAAGVPRDRIHWKILSWETPRLAASDVAGAYGLLDDWQSMTDKQAMDRSVLLVAY